MEAVRSRRLLRADIVMDLDGDADLLEVQSREIIVAEELVVEVGELFWLVSMNSFKGGSSTYLYPEHICHAHELGPLLRLNLLRPLDTGVVAGCLVIIR